MGYFVRSRKQTRRSSSLQKSKARNLVNSKENERILRESEAARKKASAAQERVVRAQEKCKILKYDENGKLCGVVFDDE